MRDCEKRLSSVFLDYSLKKNKVWNDMISSYAQGVGMNRKRENIVEKEVSFLVTRIHRIAYVA